MITSDPYTGANVSQRLESSAIEITIKNQPFASYHDVVSDSDISLYYNIRTKGHFAADWNELYYASDYPPKANSEYTMLPYIQNLPSGSQIDFQVQAIIGSWSRVFTSNSNDPGSYQNNFEVEAKSDWSTTQTITIPDTAPSAQPT
jgi:hypothetical protein